MVNLQNLLTSVVERTPKIEKVNVDGGRFIREAKVTIRMITGFINMLFSLWHFEKGSLFTAKRQVSLFYLKP